VAAILIVDDEPRVAQMVARTLEDRHTTATQTSAGGALELLEGGARFDAVITDLAMPEHDGIWLAQQLAERHPQLAGRVLFLTGGALTDAARDFLGRPGVRSLAKPFRLAELQARLDEVLGG
jgi:CheY-like chemotaxis protein